VQEDRILVATFRSLGMIAVPIAFQEVASALQHKAIDYTEGPIATFQQNKLDEIVKHVIDLRHSHQMAALVMSKASWAKQDAAGQKAILEAWAHARDFNRRFVLEEDKTIQGQLAAKGVSITRPDAAPFRAATSGVYEDFYATPTGKEARKIVEHILAAR
jgi:TRAP-type C4-dicarboxylate transport system substrate-binding protein